MTNHARSFVIAFLITLFLPASIISGQRTAAGQTMTTEAQRLAAEYWKKFLIKCNGSYWLFHDDPLFEWQDEPQFSFRGHALQPRPLRRGDSSNGVDPLPLEVQG